MFDPFKAMALKSLMDQGVNAVGKQAIQLVTMMAPKESKESTINEMPIIIGGYTPGSDNNNFVKLWDSFHKRFSPSDTFRTNFVGRFIGKNTTKLCIYNAVDIAEHPRTYQNLICHKVGEIIRNWVETGDDKNTKLINNIKTFAASLLWTAIIIVDQKPAGSHTLRLFLLAIQSICNEFIKNTDLIQSTNWSGHKTKTALEEIVETITEYVNECNAEDAKTELQHNAKCFTETLEATNQECRILSLRLLFNKTPLHSLFSNTKNEEILLRTKNYEDFKGETSRLGESNVDLAQLIKDKANYNFVKRSIYSIKFSTQMIPANLIPMTEKRSKKELALYILN